MIPILYDVSETAFISNGLGRLQDVRSCEVSEERNGIYECIFEFPINGEHFDLLKCGMVIGVTHDATGDIQPFDIVAHSKPINGIVTFHAQHISYRQTGITITMSSQTSLQDVLDLLTMTTRPMNNPFSYSADFISGSWFPGTAGIPVSIKNLLGGMKGSVLDTYGGEYEWDKFDVKLHNRRGKDSDLVIRYGVNMIDYTDETDYSETYNAADAYWGNENPISSYVESGLMLYNGGIRCVPLDLTDKFEIQPTFSQLEAAAKSYMISNQTNMPRQNITVDYVMIEELQMEDCKLCDTIGIEFPAYEMSGRMKVVKTTWDVLRDRYKEVELGQLQKTLAGALFGKGQ